MLVGLPASKTRLLQVLAIAVIVMTTFISPGLVGSTSTSSSGFKSLRGIAPHIDRIPSESPNNSTNQISVPPDTPSTLPSRPSQGLATGPSLASAGETMPSSGNPGTAPMSPSFGITMPGVPSSLENLQTLSASLGASPGIDMWYEQWSSAADFPVTAASTVIQSGATPEITWEPWNPADGVNQPAYSLSAIVAGHYDSYILRWAQEIKAWGHPLMLRFAEEMNGNWTPWDEGVNGNGPGSFVAAWDHVHALCRCRCE